MQNRKSNLEFRTEIFASRRSEQEREEQEPEEQEPEEQEEEVAATSIDKNVQPRYSKN
jgi:hypothetical protein